MRTLVVALGRRGHAARLVVDDRFVHVAGAHGRRQRVTHEARRPRHLYIEAGARRLGGGVRGPPIGHDETVPLPVGADEVGEEPRMLGAVRAVEPVVGRHQRPHTGFVDGGVEGSEVGLAQRPLVDLGGDRHAVALGVIGHEVLDATTHAAALHAFHVGDRHAGTEVRVFGVALEVPSAQGMTVQIDGGRQQEVGTLGLQLLSQFCADALHQVDVPRGRQRGPAREARRRRTAAGEGAAGAVGPVAHLQAGDAEPVDGRCVPHVDAGGERALLLERELAHQLGDLLAHSSLPSNKATNSSSFRILTPSCVALSNLLDPGLVPTTT